MARQVVTVSLPADLMKEAGSFCRRLSLTISEVTRDALRDYLAKREMEGARKAFSARLYKKKIFTESDLLKALEK